MDNLDIDDNVLLTWNEALAAENCNSAPIPLRKDTKSKSCSSLPDVNSTEIKIIQRIINNIKNNVVIKPKDLKKIKDINLQDPLTGDTILLAVMRQLKETEEIVQNNANSLTSILNQTKNIIDFEITNHEHETILSIMKTSSSQRIRKMKELLERENELRKSMARDEAIIRGCDNIKNTRIQLISDKRKELLDRRKSIRELVKIMEMGEPLEDI